MKLRRIVLLALLLCLSFNLLGQTAQSQIAALGKICPTSPNGRTA